MNISLSWPQFILILIIFLVLYYSVVGLTILKNKFQNKVDFDNQEPATTKRTWQVKNEESDGVSGDVNETSADTLDDLDEYYDEIPEITEEKLFKSLENLATDIETTFNDPKIAMDKEPLFDKLTQQIATYPALYSAPFKNAVTNLITRKLNERNIAASRPEILALWGD